MRFHGNPSLLPRVSSSPLFLHRSPPPPSFFLLRHPLSRPCFTGNMSPPSTSTGVRVASGTTGGAAGDRVPTLERGVARAKRLGKGASFEWGTRNGEDGKNGEECPVARPSCGFASHPASGFNRIKVPIRNATTIRFPARRRTFPFLPVPLFSPLPLSPIFPAPFLPLHSSLCVSCRFTSPLLPLVSRVFRFPPFVVFFSSVVPSRACSLGEPEGRRDIRVIARLFSVPKDANGSAASVAPPEDRARVPAFFLHPLRYPLNTFPKLTNGPRRRFVRRENYFYFDFTRTRPHTGN